jgi:NAD binding domain of 6-phosphogluconate dehydrogenase
MKSGFIALGRMGSAMAAKLVKAGHDVTVFNRSREKRRALLELGAHEADSVAGGLTLVGRGGHCARWTAAAVGSGLVTLMLPHGAHGDNFSKAYYDSRADQLVVSMIYRGTNPKHTFTLQWGQCQGANGSNPQEVAVQVLDSQWQDEALRPYRKTVRFSLAGIPCRPAKVTLRTAPRFIYTVLIPALNGPPP